MNADAYLRKQGWKGSGYSLDSTGRGIKKPLLIAHKQDQLGLGKKKAAYTTDDQWWMRAYDQSLQSIGTGQESTLNQIRTQGITRGGLYGFFVKGEAIKGTIEDTSATTTDTSLLKSDTTTPSTSTSETDAPRTTYKNKSKRRREREKDELLASSKKTKKTKEIKTTKLQTNLAKYPARKSATVGYTKHTLLEHNPSAIQQAAVTAKLAKMKPVEKAEYKARAAEKGQTLHQYVLRRIQKREEQRIIKYVDCPPTLHSLLT